jgi:hypothetical protein
MKHLAISFPCLLVLAAASGCGEESSSPTTCEPAAADACAAGQECLGTRSGLFECRPTCDPATTPSSCPENNICAPSAGGGSACIAICDPMEDPCGTDWRCAPSGDRGNICMPECDPAAPDCAVDEVCQVLNDGGGVCTAECDPDDLQACPGELSCELRTDGLHACYDPVHLLGRVFDLTTDAGIADGRVVAADAAGGAASDGATTAADGTYELTIPVTREVDGTPAAGGGTFTLRAGAQSYEPFPHGVRVALPIDAAALIVAGTDEWTVQNATTDIGLIPLPAATRERGSISGHVIAGDPGPGGTLVVATQGLADPPIGWADRAGAYVVFNADVGTYVVKGYKAFLQIRTQSVMVDTGAHVENVDLLERTDAPPSTVNGSLSIVDGGDCDGTSVVLVPKETYDATLERGEMVSGLRAPAPPTAPDVTGAWTIEGVPDGVYMVLAGFENDFGVRDPDPAIAGTQVLELTVPAASGARTIDISSSFKVTGALAVIFPGATEPEAVTEPLTFEWEDDSSEDAYHVVVYDAFGREVWRRDDVPGFSGGGNPSVAYDGDPLVSGMYYQFRVTSLRSGGTVPISMTEDLLGVFHLE